MAIGWLHPCVDQLEKAVVNPGPIFDFFIHFYKLRWFSIFISLRYCIELSVFSRSPDGMVMGLSISFGFLPAGA